MRFFYISNVEGDNILELLAEDLSAVIRILLTTDVNNSIIVDLKEFEKGRLTADTIINTYSFESYPVTRAMLLFSVTTDVTEAFAEPTIHTREEIKIALGVISVKSSIPDELQFRFKSDLPAFAIMFTSRPRGKTLHFSDISRGKKVWTVSSATNKPDIESSMDELNIRQLPKFTRVVVDDPNVNVNYLFTQASQLLVLGGYLYYATNDKIDIKSEKFATLDLYARTMSFNFRSDSIGQAGNNVVHLLSFVYRPINISIMKFKGINYKLHQLEQAKIEGLAITGTLVLWYGHKLPDLRLGDETYYVDTSNDYDPDVIMSNTNYITTEVFPSFNAVWDVSKKSESHTYRRSLKIGSNLTLVSDGTFYYVLPTHWYGNRKTDKKYMHPDYIEFVKYGNTLGLYGQERELSVGDNYTFVYVWSHS